MEINIKELKVGDEIGKEKEYRIIFISPNNNFLVIQDKNREMNIGIVSQNDLKYYYPPPRKNFKLS